MGGKYIIASLAGTFAIAYAVDHLIADKKIFGGTTPKTVSSKEWWEETDQKFIVKQVYRQKVSEAKQ
ncbi:hypothetical protein U1Q18_040444, partial [Sarracenia purpurea var. burkii]